MDEDVWQAHQDAAADDDRCEVSQVADIVGKLLVTKVPGRKGRYLVLAANGELMIVARLFGTSEEAQKVSERRILDWSEGRVVT